MNTTTVTPTSEIVKQSAIVETSKESKPIRVGQFNGILAGFQAVVFRDLKYAGLEDKTAHKVAMDYGSQLGLAMRNDENIKTEVSKANKHGMAKLSASFYDRLIMHNAMSIYRVVQTIADLKAKETLISGYEVFGVLPLAKRLNDYVKECELWTLTQTWEK